jgi:protein TonB
MREVIPKAPLAPAKPIKKLHTAPVTKATPSSAKVVPKEPSNQVPKAGGGPTGGRGTDVATVQTNGVDFPYPGYLNNIVRQIALNFRPDNPNSPVRAEVAFLIHRNGSVSNFRFITRSGLYTFDLQAQGAVEKAATAFGSLPDGFREDVLPVVFSFDPKFLR